MSNYRKSGDQDRPARRGFLAGLAALPLVAACDDGRQATSLDSTVLRVSASKVSDDVFFDRAGVGDTPYRLERVRLGQASVAAEALLAGAYDLNIQSNISPVFFAPTAPVRLAGFIPYAPLPFKLYVREGAGIHSVEQIRGRRVGYMRGGPLHYLLLSILDHHGLALSDIEPVALSALDSVAAFVSGDLDVVLAGLISPLWQIESAGGREIANGGDYPAFARNNGNTLAVHASLLADPFKRQAAADYVERLSETWRWIDDHLDEWSEIVAPDYGAPAEVVRRFRTRLRGAGLQGNADGLDRTTAVATAFEGAGVISRLPDLPSLFDRDAEALLGRTAHA